MSRKVEEIIKSGYLLPKERRAIDFELDLEDNEKNMGEQAAIMVTCEQHGIEYEDYAYVLIEIPEGEWWKCEKLPVKKK